MLNCKDATRLMSETLDRDLPATQKFGLAMHLLMCDGCRRYRKQMGFLRQTCRSYPTRPTTDEETTG